MPSAWKRGRWLAVCEVTTSIRCTVTESMATKFSEMSILLIILADAIAADGMVVESDPFGSGIPSIDFKYRRIDMRPAIAFNSRIQRATETACTAYAHVLCSKYSSEKYSL